MSKIVNMLTAALLFNTLLFSNVTFAQAPEWLWAKGAAGVNYNNGNTVAADNDGNIYVTGAFYGDSINFSGTVLTINNGNTDLSMFIVKYNSEGVLLWAKAYSGNSIDDVTIAIAKDVIYIAGSFYSDSIKLGNITLYNAGVNSFVTEQDIFIGRIDPLGNIMWAYSAGSLGHDRLCNIITDKHGYLYLTGAFEDTLAFPNVTLINNNNIIPIASSVVLNEFVIKVDKFGNVIWGQNQLADRGSDISVDNNQNVYVSGQLSSANTYYPNKYVAKRDSLGNLLWMHMLDGNCTAALDVDSLGNVYVSGEFQNTMHLGSITLTPDIGYVNSFLVKYETDGSLIWAKDLGDHANIVVTNLVSNKKDCLYLTGSFSNDSVNLDGITIYNSDTNSSPYRDIFVMKCDTTGNVIWAKSAGGNLGSDLGSNITTNAIGNIYITGQYSADSCYFGNNLLNEFGFNFYLAKMDTASTLSLSSTIQEENVIKVFPNPNNGKFVIQTQNSKNSDLKIYNLMGEKLFQTTINNSQTTIDLNGLSNGVYLLSIYDGKQLVNKRLVIAN
jgi:hypothetical protein